MIEKEPCLFHVNLNLSRICLSYLVFPNFYDGSRQRVAHMFVAWSKVMRLADFPDQVPCLDVVGIVAEDGILVALLEGNVCS